MKYIMYEIYHKGQRERTRVPIIFPNSLTHKVVAETNRAQVLEAYNGSLVTIISAGEINVDGICSGESTTLKLKSLGEEDTNYIRCHDYFHGIEGT